MGGYYIMYDKKREVENMFIKEEDTKMINIKTLL